MKTLNPAQLPDPAQAAAGAPAQPVFSAREPLNDIGRELLEDAQVQAILETVARNYPHVVNHLGSVWGQPAQCSRLLGDLLLDDRLSRQGFPLEAVLELSDLRTYYEERVVPRLQSGFSWGGSTRAKPKVEEAAGIGKMISSLFRR